MRRILHIDMDAFFAAVEEKRNPSLKGMPVVVGGTGDPSRRGVVATANYEARKYGIHSAMPLRTAFKACPQAIFLPVDYEAYRAVSRRIKQVLLALTPIMEDVGIDEAYLDLSADPDSNDVIVSRIKGSIYEQTGLTCSIGIAPNKLLAKIASNMQKPDGLTVLSESDIESRLWPMPIRKLHGIGPITEKHLKTMNILTVGELAVLPVNLLTGRFGHSYGQYLHQAAWGIDENPLVTHWEPKSFSRETTFQSDLKNWQAIAETVAKLTKEVSEDLTAQRFRTRTITLKIRYSDFRTITRSCSTHDPIDNEEEIRRMAFSCLRRIDLNKRVRLVGVRVGNLHK